MCSEFQITDLLVNFYNMSIYNSRDMDKVDKFFILSWTEVAYFATMDLSLVKKRKIQYLMLFLKSIPKNG